MGSGFHLLDDVVDADDQRQRGVVSRIDSVAGGAGLDPGSASRSGRALIPGGPPPGEQGSIPGNRSGSGMDLQFSRLKTLAKAGQHIQYRPARRLGEGAKRSNQAIRGKVLAPESQHPNGRSDASYAVLCPPQAEGKVRNRRRLSILRSTTTSSNNSVRRRTS